MNKSHQRTQVWVNSQQAYQSEGESNQFYQMLSRIRELEIELNEVLRDNQTIEEDNSLLSEQLTTL